MKGEQGIKRYEPRGYLLIVGMFVICIFMLFSLYKYTTSLISGEVVPPEISRGHTVISCFLFLGVLLLCMSRWCFARQKFNRFRAAYAMSFTLLLVFFTLQIWSLPFHPAQTGASPELLGRYYLAFFAMIHLLFLLPGLLFQGVILGRIYNRISYLESFIFSVNPPNILNFKLLTRYMVFVGLLWFCILLYLKIYVA